MKPIKCRLFVPDGNKWIDFHELSEKEKHRISSEFADRMGAVVNDLLSDPAAFENVRCV